MNRKNLTAAVLAGLAGVIGIAGSAQAVNVNPDGTGQVLLYPYYTVNAGNETLLSVVNTSDYAKAIKVRFLESENSVEVLDFNLYMSPYDVWVAAISPMPDDENIIECGADQSVRCEGPLLTIPEDETTCTVPMLNHKQAFLDLAYLLEEDGGSTAQTRMNQGHFEMLEMGTLRTNEVDPESGDGRYFDSWAGEAATHKLVDDVWQPADCAALTQAWTRSKPFFKATSGRWINDEVDIDENNPGIGPVDGVEAPSGGLFGGAAIVNVNKGALYTYNATALNNWNNSQFNPRQGDAPLHSTPGDLQPSLTAGDSFEGIVFGEQGEVLRSGEFDFAEDAVSYVLMHDTLMNEYNIDGDLSNTEWVVTFPTKRFYVYDFGGVSEAYPPFTTSYKPRGEDYDESFSSACEAVNLDTVWDREERSIIDPPPDCDPLTEVCDTGGPVVSPRLPGGGIDVDGPDTNFELCWETTVIRFGKSSETVGDTEVDVRPAATEILGTPKGFYANIDPQGFKYGWARIELDNYLRAVPVYDEASDLAGYEYVSDTREPLGGVPEDYQTDALNGLPFIGFSVSRFNNAFIDSEEFGKVFSSYGSLHKHRSSRKVGSDL